MPYPRYWSGTVNSEDAFGEPITNEFVDGATVMGPWAMMSPASFKRMGRGVGTGKGQRYKKQEDGRWLKVEG